MLANAAYSENPQQVVQTSSSHVLVVTCIHVHWHLKVLLVFIVSVSQQSSDHWPMPMHGSMVQSSAPLNRAI